MKRERSRLESMNKGAFARLRWALSAASAVATSMLVLILEAEF